MDSCQRIYSITRQLPLQASLTFLWWYSEIPQFSKTPINFMLESDCIMNFSKSMFLKVNFSFKKGLEGEQRCRPNLFKVDCRQKRSSRLYPTRASQILQHDTIGFLTSLQLAIRKIYPKLTEIPGKKLSR